MSRPPSLTRTPTACPCGFAVGPSSSLLASRPGMLPAPAGQLSPILRLFLRSPGQSPQSHPRRPESRRVPAAASRRGGQDTAGVLPCLAIPTPSPRLGRGDSSATQLRETPFRQRDPTGGGGTGPGDRLGRRPRSRGPRLPGRRSPGSATGCQQDGGERGLLSPTGAQGPGHGPPRSPERSGGRKREGGERKSLFFPLSLPV